MITNSIFKVSIAKLLLTAITLLGFVSLNAQETDLSDLKDFKIVIENTNNGLSMQAIKGAAWKELSFTLDRYQATAVDAYGMTGIQNMPEKTDSELTKFLFTITRTKDGIELKGLEGTAWTALSFNGQKAIVDQFGIKTMN